MIRNRKEETIRPTIFGHMYKSHAFIDQINKNEIFFSFLFCLLFGSLFAFHSHEELTQFHTMIKDPIMIFGYFFQYQIYIYIRENDKKRIIHKIKSKKKNKNLFSSMDLVEIR